MINQHRQLPGDGFDGFLARKYPQFADLGLAEKRAYLADYWLGIFAYPYWDQVLEALDLTPAIDPRTDFVERARNGRGGGEGPEHRRLKEYAWANPLSVQLPHPTPGRIEARLASGDCVDVLFERSNATLAVEVKARTSNEIDLIRGLFQCVKYAAVLTAEAAVRGESRTVEAILVIGRPLPASLLPLKNALGVKAIEITA